MARIAITATLVDALRLRAALGPAVAEGGCRRGRELSRVAGQLLWESEDEREVHYREWYERVLASGCAARATIPRSFLTNISRLTGGRSEHPPGLLPAPGVGARSRVAQAVSEPGAELADAGGVLKSARAAR